MREVYSEGLCSGDAYADRVGPQIERHWSAIDAENAGGEARRGRLALNDE